MRPVPPPCSRERDVLDLVAIGQWPGRADDELRAHAAGCDVCREVAAVASAVRAWADAQPAPQVPDASVVWYRAQVRARQEAARRAARPMTLAQVLAVTAIGAALVMAAPASLPALPTVDQMREWSWVAWAGVAAVVTWVIAGSVALAVASRD